MFPRLIAFTSTFAIICGLIAARPAAADDYDVARTLALIAGIAVIGKIIHDRHDDRKASRATTRHQYVAPKPRRIEPRPLPRKAQRKLLPGRCLRSFNTRRGAVTMFPNRCLQTHYRYSHKLPDYCGRSVRTPRGTLFGYEARCLRDNGYKLARQ